MNTESSLVTIAAAKKPPITPPLRKNELLRATAQAMYLESKEKYEAACKVREGRRNERDKAIKKAAKKLIKTANVSVCDWDRHGPYEVTFKVKVDKAGFEELERQYITSAIPKHKGADEFYKELREATVAGDRWHVLLKDKAITAKLIESGKKLLDIEQ